MKQPGYQPRFYRKWRYSRRLFAQEITVAETDVQIMTDKPLDCRFAEARIRAYRGAIERYIHCKDKRFLTSLKPIPVEARAAAIVRDMARGASRAGVGPMAAVAGAIAQYLGKALLRRGYRDVIVENGGDIFLKISRPVTVGIFAGSSALSGKLRMRIDPRQTPAGLCTSSGTVGHSLSFGQADGVSILCPDAAQADAVATAVGNRVQSAADFPTAIAFARSIRGVKGVLIIKDDRMATWGDITLA
jgi:hypothetical protein